MENLFDGIYKGKKVLVTGHTGFKGSWLCLWLTKLGADVTGYSKDIPTNPSHTELLNVKIKSLTGDILNRELLEKTISEVKPDIIFHLAAQALVRKSYTLPVETFETNVMGTINVLDICRKLGSIQAVVNITSDKCYQNKESNDGYTEEDALGGDDPYSASKGAAEIAAQSYRKSYFSKEEFNKSHSTLLANVRAGNVIGGGDWAEDRLIPDLIRATQQDKKMIMRSPNAIRPWQHVLEPIHGYLKIGKELLSGNTAYADNWNFGPDDSSTATVKEIADLAKKYWDAIHYEVKEDTKNPKETFMLKLNSEKSRTTLKWHSVWNLEQTMEHTINWYKDFYTQNSVTSEHNLTQYIIDMRTISE